MFLCMVWIWFILQRDIFIFCNFNLDNKFLNPAEQAFFMEKQEDALIAYYDQLEPEYAQILED